MAKQKDSKAVSFRNAVSLYATLLVVWGFYRVFFKIDDQIEELLIKPIVWLGPLFYFLNKERAGLESLGYVGKNLFKSIYLSLGLGAVFVGVGLISHLTKYGGQLSFSTFGFSQDTLILTLFVSFVTAIIEESVFRGFILTRLKMAVGEMPAIFSSTLMWGVIHIPVLVFVYHLGFADLSIRFLLTSVFGFGSALLFLRTGNIISSVLLHVLWSWPIILFR